MYYIISVKVSRVLVDPKGKYQGLLTGGHREARELGDCDESGNPSGELTPDPKGPDQILITS